MIPVVLFLGKQDDKSNGAHIAVSINKHSLFISWRGSNDDPKLQFTEYESNIDVLSKW